MRNLQKALKQLRKERDWTQKDLAKQFPMSEKSISHFECGDRQMDSEKTERAAEIFGLEWQKEEKKESFVVSLKDVVENGFSLSARELLGKQLVTLRVDISNKWRKPIADLADKEHVSLDEMVERALAHYVTHEEEKR